MKILIYFEGAKVLAKSGIGRALEHQKQALEEMGISYTLDSNCLDYDILHINTYGLNSRRMIRKARRLGKKVIYHAHSTEEDFRNSFIGSNLLAPLFGRYLTSLYKKADYLITPTPYSKGLLEKHGLNLPISAISNGIDLKEYQPDSYKEKLFRDYFQLEPNQKVIICVGLFFKRKGIIDFVELAKKFPDYTFIWFGHVALMSVPRNIRKIVKKDHPENVIFPGYIKGDVLEGAYSGADLFFFPSYEETEGIVVLEALASHQQVLVRDIPVYQDWLISGKNCYKASSNEEFAKDIKKIIDGEFPSVASEGFKTAEKRSIHAIGKQFIVVYQQVLAQEKEVLPFQLENIDGK